jgi:hypothetical protein
MCARARLYATRHDEIYIGPRLGCVGDSDQGQHVHEAWLHSQAAERCPQLHYERARVGSGLGDSEEWGSLGKVASRVA